MNALFLSLTLALTSYSMAVARGQSPDIGTDMVICTGVGMVTITIGPDGEPVETTHICPDAMSIFAAALTSPPTAAQASVMKWRIAFPPASSAFSHDALAPSARGPPLAV